MTAINTPTATVPARYLATNRQVRQLCGNVTRHTLLRWRAQGFPEPAVVVDDVELWDLRQVRDWLQSRQA